jgi:hypothetical protein
MRVHVLSKRTFRPHCFTYPLRVWRSQLRDVGLDLHLFYRHDDPRLVDCDVLLAVSDAFDRDMPPRWLHWRDGYDPVAVPKAAEWLVSVQNKVRALVWCDINAATGKFPHGEGSLFAYVDLYAKKQLLKDRSLYKGAYYKRDWYMAQFYNRYGAEILADTTHSPEPVPGLTDDEIAKLTLTWNHALADYNALALVSRQRYRAYWPVAKFRGKFGDPSARRQIDLSCRIGLRYDNPVVTGLRRETRGRVDALAARSRFAIRASGRMRHRKYIDEMVSTRIVLSPFGYGEICWRDFEVFLCGAALAKPRMDHIETWPDASYVPGETYIPYNWDFSDFDEVIVDALEKPDPTRAVAVNGQDRYLRMLTPAFGETFAAHMRGLVDRALLARSKAALPRRTMPDLPEALSDKVRESAGATKTPGRLAS